ncbi:MAG: amino acid-binding protein [Lentisphaeria bacterium]|nr:amino acid-binding protein [Lentisphaeria bacterium]
MKVKQLSLFVENRPGQLMIPCQILADAGISIQTLSLADTDQFGILRLIVKEWEAAKKVLEEAGCVVTVTDMVAVEVPDHPGGLAKVLKEMEHSGVNVEYMYAFTCKRGDRAILLFRFDNPDLALSKMAGHPLSAITCDCLNGCFD